MLSGSRLQATAGRVEPAVDEEGFVAIPLSGYGALIEALRDIAGDFAAGPLYYIGKKMGLAIVSRVTAAASSREPGEVLRRAAEAMESLGFGEIRVVEAGDDVYEVELLSPPSMAGMMRAAGRIEAVGSGGRRGYCHIERGLVAAVMEAALGRRVRVTEEKMIVDSGKPGCVLRVEVY